MSHAETRTWTAAATKKTLVGEILDKKSDSSAVQVSTQEGKTIWIPTKDLSPADNEFVKKWIPLKERLTCRLVSAGQGAKEVEVAYDSSVSPMKIDWNNQGSKSVKAGEKGTFRFKFYEDYWVSASVDGKEIDRETNKTKTGL